MIVVTDASQPPAVIDGGTVRDMMERIWAAGAGGNTRQGTDPMGRDLVSRLDHLEAAGSERGTRYVVVTNEAETERAEQENAPSGDLRQLWTVFIPWTKSEPMRHAG